MNLGEAPSVANFGERWPLAYFCASKPLFWLITRWRFRIWCGGKPICGGAPFYRRFSVKVASSPLCAANPPGLVRVVFLAVSPGGFSGCVARLFSGCVARFVTGCVARLFSGCVARLFSGCVARLFSGCVARLFSGCVARLFSGCVARFVTDCVVRWFLAGFARVCFPDVCQCVIAQDRASLNIEQVN